MHQFFKGRRKGFLSKLHVTSSKGFQKGFVLMMTKYLPNVRLGIISVGIHLPSASPPAAMVGAAASPPFASSAAGPHSTDSGGGQLGPNGEPVPRVVHQGWLKKRGKIIDKQTLQN